MRQRRTCEEVLSRPRQQRYLESELQTSSRAVLSYTTTLRDCGKGVWGVSCFPAHVPGDPVRLIRSDQIMNPLNHEGIRYM